MYWCHGQGGSQVNTIRILLCSKETPSLSDRGTHYPYCKLGQNREEIATVKVKRPIPPLQELVPLPDSQACNYKPSYNAAVCLSVRLCVWKKS